MKRDLAKSYFAATQHEATLSHCGGTQTVIRSKKKQKQNKTRGRERMGAWQDHRHKMEAVRSFLRDRSSKVWAPASTPGSGNIGPSRVCTISHKMRLPRLALPLSSQRLVTADSIQTTHQTTTPICSHNRDLKRIVRLPAKRGTSLE